MQCRICFAVAIIFLLTASAAHGQSVFYVESDGQNPTDTLEILQLGSDAFLGVFTEDVTSEKVTQLKLKEERGVIVADVVPDSPAARAGLKKDDVILTFNGEPVKGTKHFNRLINETPPGRTVTLVISRDGAEQTITAKLGKRSEHFRSYIWHPNDDRVQELRDRILDLHDATRAARELPYTLLPRTVFAGRRRIGIESMELTSQLGEYFGVKGGKGVLITSVESGGPAEKAGLKAGDVITAVDGESVADSGDLTRLLNKKDEGEVKLTVVRDKREITVTVTPEKRDRIGLYNHWSPGGAPYLRIEPPRITIRPPTAPAIYKRLRSRNVI